MDRPNLDYGFTYGFQANGTQLSEDIKKSNFEFATRGFSGDAKFDIETVGAIKKILTEGKPKEKEAVFLRLIEDIDSTNLSEDLKTDLRNIRNDFFELDNFVQQFIKQRNCSVRIHEGDTRSEPICVSGGKIEQLADRQKVVGAMCLLSGGRWAADDLNINPAISAVIGKFPLGSEAANKAEIGFRNLLFSELYQQLNEKDKVSCPYSVTFKVSEINSREQVIQFREWATRKFLDLTCEIMKDASLVSISSIATTSPTANPAAKKDEICNIL